MPLGVFHRTRNGANRFRSVATVVGCAALGLTLLNTWAGCTPTKENYHILSFFFDGVRDPSAIAPRAELGDSTIGLVAVVHQPFAEENCEACHKTSYRPSRNDPAACLSCHENVAEGYAWTHGALAGGACLWCHSPHESPRKWLMRGPDRKICAQCHSGTMMADSEVPAHSDPAAGCLECHFGHGGDDPIMLKPGASRDAPPPAEGPSAPASLPNPSSAGHGTTPADRGGGAEAGRPE